MTSSIPTEFFSGENRTSVSLVVSDRGNSRSEWSTDPANGKVRNFHGQLDTHVPHTVFGEYADLCHNERNVSEEGFAESCPLRDCRKMRFFRSAVFVGRVCTCAVDDSHLV